MPKKINYYFLALKTWNAARIDQKYLVPKKGTEEYNEIMKLSLELKNKQ
jgi:hypothetical protein